MVPGTSPRSLWPAACYALFIFAVAGLLFLLFFSYQCGQVTLANQGKFACRLDTGWYLFAVSFWALMATSGYMINLVRHGEDFDPGI
jgi:hypothetical protein